MKPIKSTAEILALKIILNRDIGKIWIDWAVDMLMAGFDTKNLQILAGETEPLNQFYAHDLVEKVLAELEIDYSDEKQIMKNYASFLIEKSLNGEIDNFKTIEILKDIYLELSFGNQYIYTDFRRDLEDFLEDFYLLYYAKYDFLYGDEQYYWHNDDLTKDNIDEFICEYFKQYLKQNLQ